MNKPLTVRIVTLLFVLYFGSLNGQILNPKPRSADSLRLSPLDSVNYLIDRVKHFRFNNNDSALYHAKHALRIAKTLRNDTLVAVCLNSTGSAHYYGGNLGLALADYKEAAIVSNKAHHVLLETNAIHNIALIYMDTENYSKAKKILLKNIYLLETRQPTDLELLAASYYSMGAIYDIQSQLDSANIYLDKSLQLSLKGSPFAINNCYFKLAKINYSKGNQDKSMQYLDSILYDQVSIVTKALVNELKAHIFYDRGDLVSSKRFALTAATLADKANYSRVKYTVYKTYSDVLSAQNAIDSAFYYLKKAVDGKEKHQQILSSNQLSIYENELRDEEIETKNELLRIQTIKIYSLSIIILLLAALVLGIVISIRKLKKAKSKVEQQRSEIQKQQEEILTQNEELRAQQEEITTINNRLEELVNERTARLEEKNQQVTNYAFFNAHELRRPISSILGLQEVLRLTQDNNQRLEIIDKLMDCVAELDVVVRKSQRLLDPE